MNEALVRVSDHTRQRGVSTNEAWETVHPCSPDTTGLSRYDVQRSGYEGFSVAVLDKGHITSALAADALRWHLLAAVRGDRGRCLRRLESSLAADWPKTGGKAGYNLTGQYRAVVG